MTLHPNVTEIRRKSALWSRYDLDLWPLTVKTFSAMVIRMLNIHDKFRWNPSTKYSDIVWRKTGVNGRPAVRTTQKHKPLAACCWLRRLQYSVYLTHHFIKKWVTAGVIVQWNTINGVNRFYRSFWMINVLVEFLQSLRSCLIALLFR